MANYAKTHIGNESRVELHEVLGLTGAEVSVNNLPAGAGVPFVHAHKENEEIYGVLEGAGLATIDGEDIAADLSEGETAVKALEEALKGEDKGAIDDKTAALMSASQKLGEKMYANEQAAQAAQGAAGADTQQSGAAPADDDNVVDAEVKEVKKG